MNLPFSAVALAGALFLNFPVCAEVLLTEDFEGIEQPDGNIPKFYKQPTTPGSIAVSSEQARSGKKALKIDFAAADWRKAEPLRVEVFSPRPWGGGDGMALRQDWWAGFSQYFPADWVAEEITNPDMVWQFHGWEGGPASANPPLSGVVFGDQLYVRLAQGTVPAERAASYLDLAIIPLPKGGWMDLVMDLNFDYQAGHVRLWHNGKQIVDYKGPTLYPMIGQVNEKGPSLKMGVYKWDWGNQPSKVQRRTLYIDEIRFGDSKSSFAEVTPR